MNTSSTPYVGYAYFSTPEPASEATNNDRVTSVTYPDGRKIDYVYNSGLDAAVSRPTGLTDDVDGTPSQTALEFYNYLGLDTIARRAHTQTGVSLTYIDFSVTTGDRYSGLDQFGRVVDQNWRTGTGTIIDRLLDSYDRDGDVLSRDDLVVSANSELYQANGVAANSAYDPLGRITDFARGTLSASGNNGTQLDTVSSPGATGSWDYDALGDWTSQTSDGTTTTRTFNAQDQTASVSAGTVPVYDHDGNEVKDAQGDVYTYDAWGRPVRVASGSGTTVAAYAYDAPGRQVVESDPTSTGAPIKNLYYSADGQVIEERWGSDPVSSAVKYQYVWSLAGVNTLVLRDEFSGGTLTQRLYVEQDANGDVTSLTDASGDVVARFVYDPYGNVTFMDAAGTAPATPVSWDYTFQGGRQDPVTGRIEFGARDYVPSEGRWAERDPLGLAAGDPNIYEFVGGNPVANTDPTGQEDGRPTSPTPRPT